MKPNSYILVSCFLLLLLIECKQTFAQHEYDVWYFGDFAGVDFTSGTPVVLTNGQVSTLEGSSSIADASGSLLFYTDGEEVYNKNHQQMSNGFGLKGGWSSTQSALILRQPGTDSIYYIFTVEEFLYGGLCYSIVDLTLQNGLGEVTQKNIPLLLTCTERLTAVRHANGIDYWIVIHGWNNNKFYAYHFSATGVDEIPVVSGTGTIHSGVVGNAIGYLRASHNGLQLAVAVYDNNYIELFDFDKSTGVVSNPIYIDGFEPNDGFYGVEFSPNDALLYGAEYEPAWLMQWDITSGNAATINASAYLVGTGGTSKAGALALASDGKIYMAKQNTEWLGAIQNPNEYGAGCIYIDEAVNVWGGECLAGLPNFPNDAFQFSISMPSADFTASNVEFCETLCIDFIDQSTSNPTSWQWFFSGASPATSSLQHPAGICYNEAGVYDVMLISSNGGGSDTLLLSNYITVTAQPPAPIISQNIDTLTCSVANTYQWFMNGSLLPGATGQTLIITQIGDYSVTITDATGCAVSSLIVVTNIPLPGFTVSETTLCEKFCVAFIDQSTNSPFSWQWFFPGGVPAVSFDQQPSPVCYQVPGVYDVTLITTNAAGNDTLTLLDFITVYPTPPFPTITQNGYTLTSSIATGYQWQFNSVDIPGATNQSYDVMQSGYYTVFITDQHGCVSFSTTYVLLVGMEEVNDDEQVLIYPNPTAGSFIIQLLGQTMAGSVTFEISNAIGQLVYCAEEEIYGAGWKKEINLNNEPAGVYYLYLSTKRVDDGFYFPYARKRIMVMK
ncbi:MAG: T9SS type A sorting domain-containing protein [Chitinophagales bacterium]|nr:T9SS type A sorting domain-containing protein [Chitinophagales bacterium]